jgi:hypothetical protein
VRRWALPQLREYGVRELFLLIRHALVERIEHWNQLAHGFGVRRGQFRVPAKHTDCAPVGVLGPLREQSLHHLRVTAHHIGVSLELGFLSGGDTKLFVKL